MNQVIYFRDSLSLDLNWVKHFDVMITDPPYRAHVHAKATSQSKRRGTRKRDLGFEHLSRRARQAVANYAACVKRWSIVHSDVEHSNWLSLAVQARGVEHIRTMPWVRWSMPNLQGDRPPQGFEHICCYHAKHEKRWNGPGSLTGFTQAALRGETKHKCEKPLDLALDLVSFFSDIGESVFDPFAGHGTIGVACLLLGRNYVGFENDPEWFEKAQRRIAGQLLDRDAERIIRWLEQDSEPVAKHDSPNAIRRAQSRVRDKENVRNLVYLQAA